MTVHPAPAGFTVSVDGDGARQVDLLEVTAAGTYAHFRRADGRPRRTTVDEAAVDITATIGALVLGDDDPRKITGFTVDPTATGITSIVDDISAIVIVGDR